MLQSLPHLHSQEKVRTTLSHASTKTKSETYKRLEAQAEKLAAMAEREAIERAALAKEKEVAEREKDVVIRKFAEAEVEREIEEMKAHEEYKLSLQVRVLSNGVRRWMVRVVRVVGWLGSLYGVPTPSPSNFVLVYICTRDLWAGGAHASQAGRTTTGRQ